MEIFCSNKKVAAKADLWHCRPPWSSKMLTSAPRQTLRFGDFELDVAGYVLRRCGRPIRLERQPMDLLVLLVEHRQQLVLRTDIVARLWSKDVFVDVETGVNTAVRKIRRALNDSPDASAFIETIPGRGYRFVADVEVIGMSDSDPSPVMLAVLPFENLGSDPEREYIADGLTEETIASLGHIDPEHMSVIGRTSMMAYKATRKSLATIGGELNVQYLVEGSIRGEDGILRITCTLIRVRDQAQVWSASYDREPTSLLGVQQELSTAIAEQIRLRLSPERFDTLARRHSRNADAYDLYLRGRRFWNQLTPLTTRKAVEYYTRATEIDPDYALAWAGLADAYSAAISGDTQPLDVWPRAREAAAQAIRAEPNLSEAQHALGQVCWVLEWDSPSAETAFRRAVALDASNARAHSMLGSVLSQSGRHDEASTFMRRARELEPLSPFHHAMSSQVAFQARDYAAAVERATQAIVIDPEFWVGYMMRGQVHEQLGKNDLAFEALAIAGRLSGGNSKPISLRGYLLARLGKLDDAREVLGVLQEVSQSRYVPPYAMALVHAGLGERETVFEWLDRAYLVRDVHLAFLTVDPKWDAYRADPRFGALLERCGFTRMAGTGSPRPPSGHQ
jgi:TolB-like protein/Flp pilus assembly protein TadD